MSASASMRLERGNTGRILDSITPDQCQASRLADDWFRCSDADFGAHPVRTLFAAAMSRVPVRVGNQTAFRGRKAENGALILDADLMGPHPKGLLNRYNRDGNPTLYLASTEQGVIAELFCAEDKIELTIREFQVDFDTLQVADLSSTVLPAIVLEVLDRSERVYGNRSKSDDHFRSNVLADAIREAGFDGVVVPGVRGSRENRYVNIVVFDASSRWKSMRTCRLPYRVA